MSISLERVSKKFAPGVVVVDDLTFQVEEGELLVLLGESGCGKTTTLKMINRLIEPSSGTIRIKGRNTSRMDPVELRRSIGYVFQGVGLFPHLTVSENIGITPKLLGWSLEKISGRTLELLELVRLPSQEFLQRWPRELSGGQRQRIGFARALAAHPSVLLLDEPFGALDPITRSALQRDFKEIQRKLTLTAVFVTHDMVEALLLADRILVMRGGKILQSGTPEEILNAPRDSHVGELMSTPRQQVEQLATLTQTAERTGRE